MSSLRALTEKSGAVINSYQCDAYGNAMASSVTVGNPFGYAGEYTDAESGLVYLRARYYDPTTQQFLTLDPIISITGQAYNYANGNPIHRKDPRGLGVLCLCSNFSASFALGITYSICICTDKVSTEIQSSTSTTAGFQAGIGSSVTIQTNPFDDSSVATLHGPFRASGFTIPCDLGVTVERVESSGHEFANVGISFGLGIDFGHESIGETVLPEPQNIENTIGFESYQQVIGVNR